MKSRLPVPQYSYRQSLKKEERKIYRRIALLIVAFFAILLIIWFMGTSFINTLSYIQRGNPTDTTTTDNADDLPLLAPVIDKLPDAINTDSITVSGQTTIKISVKLFVNTKETTSATSDDSGAFKFENVKLNLGANLIKVVVENKAKEKEESSFSINVDKTKPALVLNGPVDGAAYPSSTKTVNVNGTTEPNAIVHISGNQAVVDDSGKFSYNLPVIAGENAIEVNSVDEAGNATIVKLTVTVEAASAPDGPQP